MSSLDQVFSRLVRPQSTKSGISPKLIKINQRPEIPEEVNSTYQRDLNLNLIHHKIVSRYRLLKQYRVPELRKEIENLTRQANQALTIIDRKITRQKIEALTEEINLYQSLTLLNTYLEDSRDLLAQYNQLPKLGPVTFGTKVDPEADVERNRIIRSYLNVARNYIKVNVTQKLLPFTKCPTCFEEYPPELLKQADEVIVCPNCGVSRVIFGCPAQAQDNQDNNTRGDYEDRINFHKTIQQYQGKQEVELEDSLLSDLDNYFISRNLPTADELAALPLNERGKRPGTSVAILREALKLTKYEHHYSNINLIGHLYWGWLLPDISHLENDLMEDYDKSQAIFHQVKGSDRKSSLGNQTRLYWHLRQRGHPCDRRDFYLVETTSTLEYYNHVLETISERLGWPHIPL